MYLGGEVEQLRPQSLIGDCLGVHVEVVDDAGVVLVTALEVLCREALQLFGTPEVTTQEGFRVHVVAVS